MIKEHYIVKEHTDDDTSISSLSIVAKHKVDVPAGDHEVLNRRLKKNEKVETSDSSDSSSDGYFEVIKERRK